MVRVGLTAARALPLPLCRLPRPLLPTFLQPLPPLPLPLRPSPPLPLPSHTPL